MAEKGGLVFGWGINDLNRPVYKTSWADGYNSKGERKRTTVWICPYYKKWQAILERGVCQDYKNRRTSYKDVTVCEEWKYLSNFIKWVDSQPNRDWQNCEPDKDLFCRGSRIYSPLTCVFVSPELNKFLVSSGERVGGLMRGVTLSGNGKRFVAYISDPFTKKHSNIGTFDTEIEAHLAWKANKHRQACQFADLQDDPRVAERLRILFKEVSYEIG